MSADRESCPCNEVTEHEYVPVISVVGLRMFSARYFVYASLVTSKCRLMCPSKRDFEYDRLFRSGIH